MPKIFTEQDREIIRRKLLGAGLARPEHKRYRSISVDEIAADAGIASILVICQEIFKKDFDMFFLKKGALHPRS